MDRLLPVLFDSDNLGNHGSNHFIYWRQNHVGQFEVRLDSSDDSVLDFPYYSRSFGGNRRDLLDHLSENTLHQTHSFD